MIHLRIVSPPKTSAQVVALLRGDEAVCNLTVLPGAVEKPSGDLVLCDVPREMASVFVQELRELGIEKEGAILVEPVGTAVSDAAAEAADRARGEEADAVVWEEVEEQTAESAALTTTFLAFMVLASLIAAVGIYLDNPILIVGAMCVGPEFGPLAGVCVAAVERRSDLALRSALALVVGVGAGVLAAFLLTALLQAAGAAEAAASGTVAELIASTDAYSAIVAACAGIAGMLSLSTAKSGPLIGVLISVTTTPALAQVGVAAADGNSGRLGGALAQLLVNIAVIVLTGTATLYLQRVGFRRRRAEHRRGRGDVFRPAPPSRRHGKAADHRAGRRSPGR